MKSLFVTLHFALLSFLGFSQGNQTWSLYQSTNGIEIYTLEVDCRTDQAPAQKAYLVKVVNTNAYNCTVEWDLSVWYNNEKLTDHVKPGENHYTVDLKANESQQGTCDVPYGALYIFKDFITYVSPTKLTSFELENVRVTKI